MSDTGGSNGVAGEPVVRDAQVATLPVAARVAVADGIDVPFAATANGVMCIMIVALITRLMPAFCHYRNTL